MTDPNRPSTVSDATPPAPAPSVRLRRLWQPRNPLFWMMLAFNVLSSVLGWMMRTLPLNGLGLTLVGAMALGNVLMGLLAAWRLVREDPATTKATR